MLFTPFGPHCSLSMTHDGPLCIPDITWSFFFESAPNWQAIALPVYLQCIYFIGEKVIVHILSFPSLMFSFDVVGSDTVLTHWGWVTHICVTNIDQHNAWSAPSHYLTQCCIIVKWTLKNKLQWICSQNSNISFRKLHLKMSSGKPFCLGLDMLIKSVLLGPLPLTWFTWDVDTAK